MKLTKVIGINEKKCVSCHQCISVCPVKFANDGHEDVVHINEDLCIGCGQCVKSCTHGARILIDDFDNMLSDLEKGTKMIAIVAPSIASNFPDNYLNINGWLKSLGIEAFFDVSFGAELTVKSYIEHIKANKPKTVISQPCPAIVSYIEIYQPHLLKYLAPADSPMMHTIKMVKKFYPQYSSYKIAVISPCVAKKREFNEIGLGDYNVTMIKIKEHFEKNDIDINQYQAVDYSNPPAERAVLFSTPGGLLETAEREIPGIRSKTRKIEGPGLIYDYLIHLKESINKGFNPMMIDCLNCEMGCNGGPATPNKYKSHDELEFYIEKRKESQLKKYNNFEKNNNTQNELENNINNYWEEDLYSRSYVDNSENYSQKIKEPSESEFQSVYKLMNKHNKEDFKNCSSCGYNSCEQMAKAIFNGLNRKENCHFFMQSKISGELNSILDLKMNELEKKNEQIIKQKEEIINHMENVVGFISNVRGIINSNN
ncbi:MAG: [Fe-Fe] hydrogenase large subunit C-terminal domain-containing protein [Bacteroidota bacterium]|nr:[Fe-Fe] hydrogenase large subunit C-terminal domain-containing protein [Bacteroidota bacterium]